MLWLSFAEGISAGVAPAVTELAGAAGAALVIGVILAVACVVGGPRRRPPRPIEPSLGRVRLSARSLERVALAGGGVCIAAIVGVAAGELAAIAAGWIAVAALIVTARRGAFEPLRPVEDDAPIEDGYVDTGVPGDRGADG